MEDVNEVILKVGVTFGANLNWVRSNFIHDEHLHSSDIGDGWIDWLIVSMVLDIDDEVGQ